MPPKKELVNTVSQVEVSLGKTVNTGNYNSVRVNLAIKKSVIYGTEKKETLKLFEEVENLLDLKLQEYGFK